MKRTNVRAVSCVVLLAGAGALGAQVLDRPAPTPAPQRPPRPVISTKGQADDPNPVVESQAMPSSGGPLASQKPDPLRAGRPTSQDGATVESAVAALYESVSHPEASEPDWARMRELFLPVGMLIPPKPARDDIFTVLDVDGFQERVRKGAAAAKQRGEPTAFFEKETARKTDCFGNICQVFSTYEARRSPADEKPFARGINSIQLVRDARRWWIASVIWDTERADNPIPPAYQAAPK
jgi:hypothetical protein